MGSLLSPDHFPSFPVPAEGETLFSLFTRCKATSGFITETIVQNLTRQRLTSRLRAALPAYLPTIAANLHNNHPYSDPLNAIRNYSILPYLTYFMSASKRAEVEGKVASTDVTQPIGLAIGLARYPVNIMAPPRYCLSCIDEGIHENGFPFFRREHQLPGVHFCWRHRHALYHGCTRCGEYPIRNETLTLAGECGCDSGIKPLRAASMEGPPPTSLIWLAEQSACLLASSGTRFGDPAVALGRKAAAEACNRLGTVDYHSVADKVVNFFGEDVLTTLNIDVQQNGEPSPWIRRFFHRDRGHRPTLLYLLLIGAYFGSITAFETNGSEELDTKQHPPRKVVNSARLLKKHRETLAKLIKGNLELSRGDFSKKAPGAYDFLIRHDKAFFQSKIQRAKVAYSRRRERVDWHSLDTVKASELKIHFEIEYDKDEKPVFITTTSALRYCKIFSRYTANSKHFPLVSEILSANLEDRNDFHKRRLHWAITEMKRTKTPISANRLRRVASLNIKVLHSNRDFILATVHEIGGEVDNRSFLS